MKDIESLIRQLEKSSELIALSMVLQGARKCECHRFATVDALLEHYVAILCDICLAKHAVVSPPTELPQAKMARRFRLLMEGE